MLVNYLYLLTVQFVLGNESDESDCVFHTVHATPRTVSQQNAGNPGRCPLRYKYSSSQWSLVHGPALFFREFVYACDKPGHDHRSCMRACCRPSCVHHLLEDGPPNEELILLYATRCEKLSKERKIKKTPILGVLQHMLLLFNCRSTVPF